MRYIDNIDDMSGHLKAEHQVGNIVQGMAGQFHDMLHTGRVGFQTHTHVRPKQVFHISQQVTETATVHADTVDEAMAIFEEERGTAAHEYHYFMEPVLEKY